MSEPSGIDRRKKLIEVALPLEAINKASAREKSIRHGHPSSLHLWWARRPLAAARAVIFAQLVDDPSSHPDIFTTEETQDAERQRLFRLIEDLVQWENSTNEEILSRARAEILASWRATCAENAHNAFHLGLFDVSKLPGFCDPFAGGGSLPLEAQRLGLTSHASELNPIAVLISKAMIEIPPKFAARPPVNPESRLDDSLLRREWRAAQGLAEDLRFYGQWMRDEAERRIGQFYPRVEVSSEMAIDRADLKSLVGKKLTVIAWLWARTVRSPNPAFAQVEVPLVSSFMLSTKVGKEAYVEPIVEGAGYHFAVRIGKPTDLGSARNGTKLARGANFRCVISGSPIPPSYIYNEAKAGRMGARLMAIVAEGDDKRVFLPPSPEAEAIALKARPSFRPDLAMPHNPRWFSPPLYGLKSFGDLFTPRQLVALTTFSDLVQEIRERIKGDALATGMSDDGLGLDNGGTGATAYSDAVAVYLGFLVSQVANHSSSMCGWNSANTQMRSVFSRQAIPMVWDYAESNPFCDSSGSFANLHERQVKGLAVLGGGLPGTAVQADAVSQSTCFEKVVSTDPPYYDNIGYADLSDFFFVWLRRSLKPTFPELFATVSTPKTGELVATPYRHGNKEKAERFFLDGMTQAMHGLARQAHPAFPITIFYAFKQSENEDDAGVASTGWETFLEAVNSAGFAVSGTWPIRTEKLGRVISNDTNALASSIVLVCRPRAETAATATRREFLIALKDELPDALRHLQRGNIAPVDLAQASIGPGMGVYTRYLKVINAEGETIPVREALAIINQVLDEVLAEQEGTFDAESRWALAWFEQYGFNAGPYGIAETLSKAKNTGIDGLVEAGILSSKGGKVRLFRPADLSERWDPTEDSRVSAWEVVHHLIRVLEAEGEGSTSELVAKLGSKAETTREFAYRLYSICERTKRSADALSYNSLVQSWPEITRLARDRTPRQPSQALLF